MKIVEELELYYLNKAWTGGWLHAIVLHVASIRDREGAVYVGG